MNRHLDKAKADQEVWIGFLARATDQQVKEAYDDNVKAQHQLRQEKREILAELRKRKLNAPAAKLPRLDPLPGYGDHMPWAKFVEACKAGDFDDEDGVADLATATQVSSRTVSPSSVRSRASQRYPWATHVVWYNK